MHTDPIAFFITWTCYGTWMPGDERGWTKWHNGDQVAQPLLENWCRERLSETAIVLDDPQRDIVENVIREHCRKRQWKLHAVNCRMNHCHVVVTAPSYHGEQVRDQLKSWATRRLKNHQRSLGISEASLREHWWTRKGSVRYLFDDNSLESATIYTMDAQEGGGSKANHS